MKIKTGIVCTGCNRDSSELSEYTKDDPVTGDGTYADRKFVCTECYIKLIPAGMDVGTPHEIQQAARIISGLK